MPVADCSARFCRYPLPSGLHACTEKHHAASGRLYFPASPGPSASSSRWSSRSATNNHQCLRDNQLSQHAKTDKFACCHKGAAERNRDVHLLPSKHAILFTAKCGCSYSTCASALIFCCSHNTLHTAVCDAAAAATAPTAAAKAATHRCCYCAKLLRVAGRAPAVPVHHAASAACCRCWCWCCLRCCCSTCSNSHQRENSLFASLWATTANQRLRCTQWHLGVAATGANPRSSLRGSTQPRRSAARPQR